MPLRCMEAWFCGMLAEKTDLHIFVGRDMLFHELTEVKTSLWNAGSFA